MLEGKTVLLVITGGIAAYKSIELIRLLQTNNAIVVPVMTKSAQQFIKPISVAAIAGSKVYTELFDLTAEAEMGHIELSRSADIILVAPASADFLSKMAQGSCDDLASTLLLATDKPVVVAPSMNVRMWHHPATQRNLNAINDDGIITIGPNEGGMACGEFGLGRMSEPTEIVAFLNSYFKQGPLSGKRIIVTSGTTHEMIDPVRYIANRSSGEQGSAIASALADLGANVIFITGPSTAPIPANVELTKVKSGREMHKAVLAQLPADVAIFVAAVSDWYMDQVLEQKIKKQANNKISLATVYNTVHAFEKKGYLKQIPINSSETYFDTNVTDHHHFYDLKEEKLIDLENSDVGPINILKKINGKKIKSVEVLVKLED